MTKIKFKIYIKFIAIFCGCDILLDVGNEKAVIAEMSKRH